MVARVGEVRCVEIEMADPTRAAEFYANVWNLKEVGRENGSIYFRGTGPCHHVLAIHHRPAGPALRRVVFNAKDKATVDALCAQVRAKTPNCEDPKPQRSPGGGYGFGFTDVHNCNYAVIAGVSDHADKADVKDRPRKVAHVNVNTPDQKATLQFMVDALGFKLVDESGPLMFLNADSTDHSSMVIGKHTKPTLNHVAYEMPDLDSVMRGVGRMKDNGYPTEWGPGRHGAGDNVFAYFAGPEEFPIEYTGDVLQIDETYQFHGPEYWKWPPGRADQWGITNPHTPRWKRIQEMIPFTPGAWKL
jgi:catechol 2,3-dioxygenase